MMEAESNASRRPGRLSDTAGRGLALLAASLVVAGAALAPRVIDGLADAAPGGSAAAAAEVASDVPGGAAATGNPLASEAIAPAADPVVVLRAAPNTAGPVDAGAPLIIDIEIANQTDEALSASVARVHAPGAPIDDGEDLDAWIAAPSGDVIGQADVRAIIAGGTATVSVEVPAGSLAAQAGSPIVAIGVELVAGDATVAATGTAFASTTPDAQRQVSVAMIGSITIPPQTAGLADAEQLESWTSPVGLLTRQLDALAGRPVAIGVDPRIIVSIRVLGTSAPPTAVAWLERLSAVSNEIFPLAYADADIALESQLGVGLLAPTTFSDVLDPARFQATGDGNGAMPAAGAGEPTTGAATGAAIGATNGATAGSSPAGSVGSTAGLAEDAASSSPGTSPSTTPSTTPSPTPTAPADPAVTVPTTEQLLAWPYTRTDLAWPADDSVGSDDLATFRAAGLTTTILSAGNVEPGVSGSAASQLGGETALVSDDRVSAALRATARSTSDVAQRESSARLLAELALTAAEPGDPVSLLATLDRDAATSPTRIASALDRVAEAPSAQVIPLTQVIGAPPVARTLVDRSEDDVRHSHAERLVGAEAEVTSFATVLNDPTLLTAPVRRELLALLDIGWRTQPEPWNAAVGAWLVDQTATTESISVVPSSTVNVLSTETGVPTTIENRLPYPANVTVHVAPSNGRLIVDEDVSVTLAPESRSNVRVPVEAGVGSGQVELTVTLISPTGVSIGRAVGIDANVQADWEGVGAAILAVIVVAFFGFGLWRTIRRRRRERATASSDADAPAAADASGAADDSPRTDASSEAAEEREPEASDRRPPATERGDG